MEFTRTEAQRMLAEGARRFLEESSSTERVREVAEGSGFDVDLWRAMAEQGWQAMHIPEVAGGAGFTFAETAILLEEMGRMLAPVPYVASAVVAADLLMSGGSEVQRSRWLPGIASGEIVATVALLEPGGGWDEASVGTTVHDTGGGYTLQGVKSPVSFGHVADLLIVTARHDAGVGLYLVEASGVAVEQTVALDTTQPQAVVNLDAAPAERLGHAGWSIVESAYDLGRAAIACEQVGGAQRVLEVSVEYAKERKQFGRPIGSFQAIKHKCADMLVELESARSAAMHAAWVAANHREQLAEAAPLAKAYCSEAFFHAAAETIQIHGGIGFTWEHDAHLYFKRAKSSELMFGAPEQQRSVLAERIGL